MQKMTYFWRVNRYFCDGSHAMHENPHNTWDLYVSTPQLCFELTDMKVGELTTMPAQSTQPIIFLRLFELKANVLCYTQAGESIVTDILFATSSLLV